jgi:hypothetical protein
MREIKFRAWHKQEKRMKDVSLLQMLPYMLTHVVFLGIEGHKDTVSTWHPEDCELMQFTGLLDKNGKEIYEGDILRVEGYELGSVRYHGTSFVIQFDDLLANLDTIPAAYMEIIGNIYENPDLLELTINGDTLKDILAINDAIQHRNAQLSLDGRNVMCVTMDGTCAFDGQEENDIKLTKTQLNDLLHQALQNWQERTMKLLGMGEKGFQEAYLGRFVTNDETIRRLGGTIPEE